MRSVGKVGWGWVGGGGGRGGRGWRLTPEKHLSVVERQLTDRIK